MDLMRFFHKSLHIAMKNQMEMIAHRGFWTSAEEKNTAVAFQRAFDHGFGVETDVRDCCGTLVISHNPPGGAEMTFADFLAIHSRSENRPTLALNIKADGLHDSIAAALRCSGVPSVFVFDMSIPDTLAYFDIGIPVFMRQSEYEPVPSLYEKAAGIWLDAFSTEWYSTADIEQHLGNGKKVCVVSSELHGRDHRPLWKRLKDAGLGDSQGMMLCTDLPHEARETFGL